MSNKTISFYKNGLIEKWSPSRKKYVWVQGYAEKPGISHTMCRKACSFDARSRGKTPSFRDKLLSN